MYKEIIESSKKEMEKIISFLSEEFSKIRTGRANPSLIEDILVDCFGEKLPLKQLAAISLSDAKTLLIQPWDKSYTEGIFSAISNSGMNLQVSPSEDSVRVSLPSLSDEYRDELSKIISLKQEDARRAIRKKRDDAWGEIQEKTRKGEIREDDKFRAKDELQKVIDDYNERMEKMKDNKLKEIKE